ncbi:MAG: hypothetical protein SXV54_23275 [Chloroflexota bacterium]|nr:hypothetical protein [Chloroflexota bacterium]
MLLEDLDHRVNHRRKGRLPQGVNADLRGAALALELATQAAFAVQHAHNQALPRSSLAALRPGRWSLRARTRGGDQGDQVEGADREWQRQAVGEQAVRAAETGCLGGLWSDTNPRSSLRGLDQREGCPACVASQKR